MRFIGNIIWFLLIGLWSGLAWLFLGILYCITIIGIPIGIQLFKFAQLSFFPFGKDVMFSEKTSSLLLNIIWLIFGGIELGFGYLLTGLIFCITIIGIPFGKQCFKLMKISFLPFGANIVTVN
ncbi:MAG: YccF domain-containing protein [Treponema sp.]|nr:YccF domain-containing protein [Spirochaetia bacterium]MDD7580035.1 YccF domain-containing protein [Treponema sp.]MCI7440173.1 YccF domain-containing protein [Spirochaetia bacterium]MDY3759198.1 YccF domain-containing protein [Treponema sp.]MDY4129907.1 YccF domain-containing protein [Treponema sp.]